MYDTLSSESLRALINEMNNRKIQKEDIVSFFQNSKGFYTLVFYKNVK